MHVLRSFTLTVGVQIRARIVPSPGSWDGGVRAQLLLREAALHIGVALDLGGRTGPRPGCVPRDRVAGHAVDLRALRACTGAPAPTVGCESVSAARLRLVLATLLSGTLFDGREGRWSCEGKPEEQAGGIETHDENDDTVDMSR